MSATSRNYDEKRNFIRMTMNSNASLTTASGDSITVKCRDLSATGMLIHASEAIIVGTPVKINIPSPNEQFQPMLAIGTILRCEEPNPGDFEIGVLVESIE